MVEFALPKKSRVVEGKTFHANGNLKNPKRFFVSVVIEVILN